MKTRTLGQLAEELRQKYAEYHSWRKAALNSHVMTPNNDPDPGLAQRIATKGYDPRREETRQRLGLPPVCVTCHARIKRVRHVPAWLDEAVVNLRVLEGRALELRVNK